VTMRERRMNTTPECQLRFACLASPQSKMRNGMEEVVGSIPTRSTKSPSRYRLGSVAGEASSWLRPGTAGNFGSWCALSTGVSRVDFVIL